MEEIKYYITTTYTPKLGNEDFGTLELGVFEYKQLRPDLIVVKDEHYYYKGEYKNDSFPIELFTSIYNNHKRSPEKEFQIWKARDYKDKGTKYLIMSKRELTHKGRTDLVDILFINDPKEINYIEKYDLTPNTIELIKEYSFIQNMVNLQRLIDFALEDDIIKDEDLVKWVELITKVFEFQIAGEPIRMDNFLKTFNGGPYQPEDEFSEMDSIIWDKFKNEYEKNKARFVIEHVFNFHYENFLINHGIKLKEETDGEV